MNTVPFQQLAPFGIVITTHELRNRKYVPIVTHVFWGQNYDEAFRYAKSHLLTDVFYSSSFVGELPWGDSVLILGNTGRYLGIANAPLIQDMLADLASWAEDIHQQQEDTNIIQTVQMLSRSD